MDNAFDAACVEIKSVSKIKFEEAGRKVIILNPKNLEHNVVRVDGCVIKKGKAADWIVCKAAVGSVVIELKGVNLGHALHQIEATLAHCAAHDLLPSPIGALIMCKQVPKAGTTLQAAASRLRKTYKAKLKVSSSQFEFDLAALV